MVMGSYSLVILKCVAQGMPSSTFFCDSGDMITMRKANSGFFTGVVNSEWPVTARPTALFVVPPPCLPTHQDASLLSVITTVTDPPRYSPAVNLVRSSPTFCAELPPLQNPIS